MEGVDLFMGLIAPVVNFLIFMFLAVKLFKKPILGMIAARKEAYEGMVAEASKAKQEAEEKQKELDSRIASLDSEMEEMRENARKTAEATAKAQIEKAKNLAEHMKEESKRMADAQFKQAKEQLQADILAEVTLQVTDRLKKDIAESKHKSLVTSRIDHLKSIDQEA